MPGDAYAIAASGMAAQQTQMDLIAANLANVATTRTPSGGPYHARSAILQATNPFSVALDEARADSSDAFFAPDNLLPAGDLLQATDMPAATMEDDAIGFNRLTTDDEDWARPPGVEVAAIVERSNGSSTKSDVDVDPIEQMVALVAAGRSYDANVAVLQAVKQMDLEASDISRLT